MMSLNSSANSLHGSMPTSLLSGVARRIMTPCSGQKFMSPRHRSQAHTSGGCQLPGPRRSTQECGIHAGLPLSPSIHHSTPIRAQAKGRKLHHTVTASAIRRITRCPSTSPSYRPNCWGFQGSTWSASSERFIPSASQSGTLITTSSGDPCCIVLLGGAGRIGTAAAIHLLSRASDRPLQIILTGRSAAKGNAAVAEVEGEVGADVLRAGEHKVLFKVVDWSKPGSLKAMLQETKPMAVLHTAGPFDEDMDVGVLREAIEQNVAVYVDVADPIPYLDAAKDMSPLAAESGTMALVSAGAFPGFSNVLAVECARRLGANTNIKDVRFAYFTAGLGGSGAVNLLITNVGFGMPVPTFRQGRLDPQPLAGASSKQVDFFLDDNDPAKQLVGTRDVWPWPFPEAATVPRYLKISGNSDTGMGTAPGLWNKVLVALVALVPRDLWLKKWFSEGLAWFSLPMVLFTDQFVGETHAMRVEVEAEDGCRCIAVQSHESFRRCVAQSAAEFVLELLERRENDEGDLWKPGVYLPEELAETEERWPQLLERLSSTTGTTSCGFRVDNK